MTWNKTRKLIANRLLSAGLLGLLLLLSSVNKMDELSKIILACALLVLLILAIIALVVWYSMRARNRGLELEVEGGGEPQ